MNAKAHSNKQYDHGVRTFRPTSPLPTPGDKSTNTIRFGSRNFFYTLGFLANRKLYNSHSCNHTLHPLSVGPSRVSLKCSVTTSPQARQPTPLLLGRSPTLTTHSSLGVQVYYKVIITISTNITNDCSQNKVRTQLITTLSHKPHNPKYTMNVNTISSKGCV